MESLFCFSQETKNTDNTRWDECYRVATQFYNIFRYYLFSDTIISSLCNGRSRQKLLKPFAFALRSPFT